MTDKIRWGILSTAGINHNLLDPIREARRSELAAVASRSLEKARTYAQDNDIPQTYGSYEELLAAPDIDVIYNPLPNTLHAEWSVKAAQAGKHVLCEKPLVPTLEEMDQIEAAAQTHNVVIFEAFMSLHHPQTRKIQEMIQSGQLGELQLISSWFHYYLPPKDTDNIRLKPSLAGGSLWDVGVYPNSLAIMLVGQPPVEVWGSQIKDESGVDIFFAGQLKFADGVVAQISSGFRSPFRTGAHIVGSRGLIKITEPWKPGLDGEPEFIFADLDGHESRIEIPFYNAYRAEVEAMEACLLDGAEPVVPLSLSRHFLRSVLALYQSADAEQPARLIK